MTKDSHGRRILIVDDDPEVRALLQDVLEGEGFHVDIAVNGRQGLDLILSAAPDLVLLDIEMPVMNGWEVVRLIKGHTLLRHLPVLLLTSLNQTDHKVRGIDLGADDYLTKPFNIPEVMARVRGALKRVSVALEANPLTRLPGNNSIEQEISARIRAEVEFAVLYADLNNFKAFNDRYGFLRGDKLIQETARILLDAANGEDFVGHVGGDDFIVVSVPDRAEDYCRRVIETFDAMVPDHYDAEDLARGGVELADRQGKLKFFPLVGIAIGGVTNAHRPLTSIGQVSGLGAETKKYAKAAGKSAFAFDRRTD